MPCTGTPSAWPIVRPVTMPTRSPVKGPGPLPTATAVRSAGVSDAEDRHEAMSGATHSVWARGSRCDSTASTRVSSWRATVIAEVEVSMARISTAHHPSSGRRGR